METSTRCIIELLQFRRRGSESIDEALSRFETCRQQTQTQAVGFDLPIPVVAWLLLEALRVPRASWPLVLAPWNNQLPQDDPGLTQLMVSIRHQGHIAEHPIAGNYSWNKSFHAEGSFMSGGSPLAVWPLQDDGHEEWESGYPTSETSGWPQPALSASTESYLDDSGWMACSHCGA